MTSDAMNGPHEIEREDEEKKMMRGCRKRGGKENRFPSQRYSSSRDCKEPKSSLNYEFTIPINKYLKTPQKFE